MKKEEIKARLLLELKKSVTGASTRHLCNLLFREENNKYIVIPGNEKMSRVYYFLKSLSKKGEVISVYPGFWKLNQK